MDRAVEVICTISWPKTDTILRKQYIQQLFFVILLKQTIWKNYISDEWMKYEQKYKIFMSKMRVKW